ncbi:MAG: hypothetical protein ACU0DW_04450 [Shimia sp.]
MSDARATLAEALDARDAEGVGRALGLCAKEGLPEGRAAWFELLALLGRATGALSTLETPHIERLHYSWEYALEQLLSDGRVGHWAFVENGNARWLAVGIGSDGPPLRRPHVPLERAEAEAAMAPVLAELACMARRSPFLPLKLCWSLVESPLAPFDAVVWAWLEDQSWFGGGSEADAFRTALAFAHLHREGRQRLGPGRIEAQVWPRMADAHPLVASQAGYFLGGMYDAGEERLQGKAPPLSAVLDRIATLPGHRRAVAGAFLNGLADCDDPFHMLATDGRCAAAGFDVREWILRVLDGSEEERYISGAQAFWFYIHEYFCTDVPFVVQLIKHGHHWIAWMCITELHPPAKGMDVALRALAAADPEGYGPAAQRILAEIEK